MLIQNIILLLYHTIHSCRLGFIVLAELNRKRNKIHKILFLFLLLMTFIFYQEKVKSGTESINEQTISSRKIKKIKTILDLIVTVESQI